MDTLSNVKLLAKNLKCLSSELQGFETIKPVNLIIGRNNSGKSTLIDIVEFAVANNKDYKSLRHRGASEEAEIVIEGMNIIEESQMKKTFIPKVSDDIIGDHRAFGQRLVGRELNWKMEVPNEPVFVSIDPPEDTSGSIDNLYQRLLRGKTNPFSAKAFRRLSSDRDVRRESDTGYDPEGKIVLSWDGDGATNLIRQSLTSASRPTKHLKSTLLNELNTIFNPDCRFSDITVRQLDVKYWEVFLEEPGKGLIRLSRSGSGLKTIILALINLHLIPYQEKKELNQYIFGFEELENNLHPALQRRLLLYLRKIAIEKESIFFLTTHSSVAIDLFSNDKQAQILHVTNDGKKTEVTRAVTYVHHKGVLDDLDVRASDLLQSNGVVWVEGPSDRIYFKRWIEIWTDNKLIEGAHYQCVFYGGRLLSHLSADDPEMKPDDLVKILWVNRNAILVLDSDRDKKGGRLGSTKNRIIAEIKDMKGISWTTAGKEVENYIPAEALRKHYSNPSLSSVGKFQSFPEYLESVSPGEGKRFSKNKVLYAEEISSHFTKENLESTLDLKKQLNDVCKRIASWNGMSL